MAARRMGVIGMNKPILASVTSHAVNNALSVKQQRRDLAACAMAINRHHAAATRTANEAIQHAKEAGRLLLEVKATLPHGEFILWLRDNVSVSVRQAQRYMSASQGKSTNLEALASKYDAVSHLVEPTSPEPPEHLAALFKPDWRPDPGHWYIYATDEHAVWVVPDAKDTGLFHVSRLYAAEDESLFDGTSKPIEAWLVEDYLRIHFGIEDAWLLPWDSKKKSGLSRPFGGART